MKLYPINPHTDNMTYHDTTVDEIITDIRPKQNLQYRTNAKKKYKKKKKEFWMEFSSYHSQENQLSF